MAMYHQSPHVRTESEVSTPGNIWKDTSEAELYGNYLDNNNQDSMQLRPTMGGRSTMTMGALGSERGGAGAGGHPDITVGLLEDENDAARNKTKAYSGRKRVWPGALFLLLMVIGGSGAITYFGVKTFNAAQDQQQLSEDFNSPIIAVTPTLKVCRVPNYVTSGTKLYATADTDKHEVHFTGINWSGMENVEGVPHGLAVGQSKLETIAKKLAAMNINAVRLPLNAKMIIDDSKPDTTRFVSRSQTDLFGVSTYMEMIKKIVQGLARQQIAVLLDLHKIDPAYNASTSEKLWYTAEYPEKAIIAMFKKLATSLCNEQHYNIIGIDIKNEPVDGCWPAKDTDAYCPPERNWPRAVERIAAGILEVCPNWLIVVEGLGANALSGTFNGVKATYSDWFGASLQNATKNPIVLPVKNKVVYAPHFYSPSVYPSAYFFEKQSSEGDSVSVTEYPNTPAGTTSLQAAVKQVLDNAFGEVLSTGTAPVFYGEFGGIYGVKELLAGKTSTRTIDYLIQYADAAGMIGGFSWSLNPDSIYDFNDVYSPKKPFQFGLYADSKWDEYNTDYAKGLTALKGNGIIPCFARTVLGSSAGSTAGTATVGNTTVGNTTKKNATAPATAPATATNTTKLLL